MDSWSQFRRCVRALRGHAVWEMLQHACLNTVREERPTRGRLARPCQDYVTTDRDQHYAHRKQIFHVGCLKWRGPNPIHECTLHKLSWLAQFRAQKGLNTEDLIL